MKTVTRYLASYSTQIFGLCAIILGVLCGILPETSYAAMFAFAGPLKISRLLPNIEAIPQAGAAGTALLKCPIGLTYHQIWFTIGSLDLAEITGIRVKANGITIQEYPSGTILGKEAEFDRRTAPANDGIFAIDFDRFGMRVRQQEELSSLGTGIPDDPRPITTLHVELDIDTAADTPTITAHAMQSVPRPSGIIRKLRKFIRAIAGAGDYELSDLPTGDVINRIFFHESANDIDRLRIKPDNYELFDRTKEINTRIQLDGVRTPQADLYAYDPTEQGNGTEQLLTANVQDLRFILTVDGAMTATILVDYFGALGN